MKKLGLFLTLLCTILLITGCRYSKEEKKYIKQLEKQASENAINYIQNKYGFSANIVSTEVEKANSDPIPDLTPSPTGNVFVNLKYNHKIFQVSISGKEQTIDGVDNYQYEEIVSETLKYLNNKINMSPYKNLIYYGKYFNEETHNGLINDLYTNDNIEQIIENNNFNIILEYINKSNLQYVKDNNLLDNLQKTKIILVNYNSLESYNNASTHDYNLQGTFIEEYFEINALNIESAYVLDYGKTHYLELDVKQFKDIYYYDDNSQNVTLTYTTISDVSNWIGKGAFKNVTQISDAYLVSGNYSNLYIYLPINKINGYNVNNINVGIECYGKFDIANGKIVGDYFVSQLYLNSCDKNYDTKFTLLHSNYEK